MRPIFLGVAAVALFVGGVVMAPLTSEIALSVCPAGDMVSPGQFGFSCETANAAVEVR
ncbi:hypothetical protein [Mycolicibacterium mengxianglii]|uniref:hypothetical protein n=1 Tax=Mycolicibacterium mengxianglii TaxID=2736649 RepID=UPI0018D15A5A|nr:hypothetical protein [Mycolicibacterium mengxianglii]